MGGMHGEGRGRGRGRVKRKHVEAGDGWTVVTHGLEKMALGGTEQRQDGNEKERGKSVMAIPEVVQGLTAETLLEGFTTLQKRWAGTALAAQIRELVGKKTRRWNGSVENAVCVGIGSFSRDWAHRWRSLWQLVLFVGVVGHLNLEPEPSLQSSPEPESESRKEKDVSSVPLYAQDPAFTPLDTTFLSLLNITTTPTNIERHITPTTFLYSPFVDWYLLLPTFLSAPANDPVLYIGNEVLENYGVYAQTEEKREKLEECNELGKRFVEGREVVRLVEGEGYAGALGGLVVLWKSDLPS